MFALQTSGFPKLATRNSKPFMVPFCKPSNWLVNYATDLSFFHAISFVSMAKSKFLLGLALFALALVFGCCISPPEPDESHITFEVPAQLLEATVGQPYSYSFCEPEAARSGAVCGGLTPATNPLGGRPPYSLTYGEGMHPPGINLQLNGLYEGTPTLAGSYDFNVCARDGFGTQACQPVAIQVNPAPPSITVEPDNILVKAPICFNKPCTVSTKVLVTSDVPWKISFNDGSAARTCYDTVAEFSRYWSICPPSGPAGQTEVELSTMVFGESTPDDMEPIIDRGSLWRIASVDNPDDYYTELRVALQLSYYNK